MKWVAIVVLTGALVLCGGCQSSKEESQTHGISSTSPPRAKAKQPEAKSSPAGAGKEVASRASSTEKGEEKVRTPRPAVPSGTLFNRVKQGQSMKEVVALIGDADESRGHLMGKNFIPFYFGKDRYRTTWYYKGEGRLVFNTGAKLMKIERDKNEDGTKN